MVDEIFKLYVANFDKLKKYGFKKVDDKFVFQTLIMDGQFTLFVTVNNLSKVSTKVIDNSSNEEYVLHLVGGVGEFVGNVRIEIEKILVDIKNNCFEKEIYKSKQTKEIIEYVRKVYGDELEFLWEKFPTDAIWRRKDNKKWYGLIMTLSKRKLGLNSDDVVEIMDVRGEPEKIATLVDDKNFFKGYHMNKNHWLTFCLDGSVSTSQIYALIDESYALAK